MGLADLLRRRERPGQGRPQRASISGRATRSSATARSSPGSRFNTSLHRGADSPARPACAARSAHVRDPEGRRRSHRRADGRRRLRGERAAAAGGAARAGARRRSDGARRRARDRSVDRFGGSGSRYRAALAALPGSTVADARAIIADRLARDLVEARFRPQPPSSAEVAEFLTTYAGDTRSPRHGEPGRALARRRRARPCGRDDRARRGLHAPAGQAAADRHARRPLPGASARARAAAAMRSRPPAAANVARAVLGRFAKDAVYDRWLRTQQQTLLANAVCARDDVPSTGDIDLTAWAPFLGA